MKKCGVMFCLVVLSAFGAVTELGATEEFLLEVPGEPTLNSGAVITGGTLIITDAKGRRFSYERRRDLDDANGSFLGFYCREAEQYLRWPAGGRGTMYLGQANRGVVRWRESQMRVRAVDGRVATVRRPVQDAFAPSETDSADRTFAGPVNLDVTVDRNGNAMAAYFDSSGRLRWHIGRDGQWRSLDSTIDVRFAPGSPLLLRPNPESEYPTVFVVDRDGRLTEIVDRQRTRTWDDQTLPQLVHGGHLAMIGGESNPAILAIGAEGRLWKIGWRDRQSRAISGPAGTFLQGNHLTTVRADGDYAFLIDRQGDLVQFHFGDDGIGRGPVTISQGFVPGGWVNALATSSRQSAGGGELYVTSIDRAGRLRLYNRRGRDRWSVVRVGDANFRPGAPVGLSFDRRQIGVSVVSYNGRWQQWTYSDHWSSRPIADGFAVGTPIQMLGADRGFAVDRLGRLVAAGCRDNAWHCVVCTPQFPFAPELVSRRIVPNPPLPPAEVELSNSHKETLIVRITDRRQPSRQNEVKIGPGEAWKYRFDRDAGGVLEEVFLVPTASGGVVEQTYRYPLPPQQLYDAVVYADRVTSVYFDRTKNKSNTPDSVGRSLVSIGVFSIPAGDRLSQGQRLDVHGLAKSQNNPGAAAWFGRP